MQLADWSLQLRVSLVIFMSLVVGAFAAACSEDGTATQNETETRKANQEQLAQNQAAEGMSYSPTRDNLIKWADTWEQQGKLSYVYFFNSTGELGYYIFEGLPASYCASLTPPQEMIKGDWDRSVDAGVGTAPALDGAYYSGSGCQQFFGFGAETGTYFEFTVGGDFNYFLSDSPLESMDMKPITGSITEEEAAKLK